MHTEKRGFLSQLDVYFDMLICALSVYIAFFFACLIDNEPPVFPTTPTIVIGILVYVLLTSFILQRSGAYQPFVTVRAKRSYFGVIKALSLMFIAMLILSLVFGKSGEFVFYVYWNILNSTLASIFLITKRRVILTVLGALRKNQLILKRTIIVGDNTASAKAYIEEIALNPSAGIMILGYVGDKIEPDVGCEKLGSFKDLEKIFDRYCPTDVVFAIDSYDKRHLIKLVNLCNDRCIKVYFLPVIYGFFKSPKQIEQIGNVPIINAHTNPLSERGNALIKRAVDIVGSLALIILTSPFMLLAVIGIKLTSDGPILFKQERVGLMGKRFMMYKFRSMPVNRDTENNWTVGHDARPNKFGSFIRRFAIDELPQLFNVLFGSMSLVGPRPEMPKYVEQFREEIPLYMIKHYVKPGVTGLAQIKGLRGDTSLEERIQVDISYIENWNLWMDFLIILKTPFKAFNKYERYVKKVENDDAGIIGAVKSKFARRVRPAESKPNQKILYVASTVSHIESFHRKYINALTDEGHTVLTMANGDGADFNVPFEKKMLSKQNRKCRKTIREILDKENFDLVILNTSLAAFHVRLAARMKYRPRIINIVHGYLFSERPTYLEAKTKSKILLLAERFLRRKTDAILTMNEEDLHIATHKKLATGPVIPTFGMGVPTPVYTTEPGTVRSQYSKESEFVLCYAAELSDRKNQRFLIAAMPEILLNIPEARLWLVGDGDITNELRDMAEDLGIANRIDFLGRRNNPKDFMRDCDLYVSPSMSEGLPFNVVEALSCGKTVLASRIKGHVDILADGIGILFRSNNQYDFIKCLKAYYEGKVTVSDQKIVEGYYNFSEEAVFSDTYDKIKEAGWL